MIPEHLLVAEVKLVYKTKVKASDRVKITCSKDAFDVFFGYWDKDTVELCEEFKMLLLNRSNRVLGLMSVSKGGVSGTVTDIRSLFQAAIKANAAGIIVAHNHPSGNLDPSETDKSITARIKTAGEILDIQLLDHLILSPEEAYFSFADHGIL